MRKDSPTESVEKQRDLNEYVVINNNDEEEEKEGNLWGIIEIDNVMNNRFDTFNNHASEILNKLDEAVLNGISDICVKLDSIENSPNVCNREES